MYVNQVKPFLDRLVALLVMLLTLPVIAIVLLVSFVANRGKVFFIQQRPGKDERPFHLLKLRTMNDARDAYGQMLPDSQRLTPVGRFLRRTSLDEWPQLINILKGEMSFVGPRPLLMEYLPLYQAWQRRRHDVRPGITGWAQVNGRNAIGWTRKFELDVWYVDHCSFSVDLKILLMTVWKVIRAEGISSADSETMEKFDGNS